MELRLLKEGEEGYGLLVEKDSGYISPQSNENRKIIKEMNEVGTSYGPIQMIAVLQKCGVQNRNGRVYPRDILMKEVEKHQEVINNGRAIATAAMRHGLRWSTKAAGKHAERIAAKLTP